MGSQWSFWGGFPTPYLCCTFQGVIVVSSCLLDQGGLCSHCTLAFGSLIVLSGVVCPSPYSTGISGSGPIHKWPIVLKALGRN